MKDLGKVTWGIVFLALLPFAVFLQSSVPMDRWLAGTAFLLGMCAAGLVSCVVSGVAIPNWLDRPSRLIPAVTRIEVVITCCLFMMFLLGLLASL